MRICILNEYFYPDSTGGSGAILSTLVRRLKDQYEDLEIDVITSKNLFRGEAGTLAPEEDWRGVKITRLSTPQPDKKSVRKRLTANMQYTAATFKALLARRGRKYDAILVVTAPPTLPLAAYMFARVTGTPYVYLVYDLYLDMAMAMGMIRKEGKLATRLTGLTASWFRRAAKVVILGRCMQDVVQSRYGVTDEQAEVIPIPANLEMVKPQPLDTEFRRKHGLSGFVVLYSGNFAQYQDFDTLLDAAKQLKDRADITFAFVGDGAKKEHIQSRVEGEKLTNVRMMPFVPEEELSDLLASASVSLVTLEKEMVGLAVPSKFYNIMASGRATVAVVNPLSEVGRVVAESGVGVQIDPENPARLAEVIGELATQPERVEEMGRIARALCEQEYSLSHVAQRFHEVFQAAASMQTQPKAQAVESQTA